MPAEAMCITSRNHCRQGFFSCLTGQDFLVGQVRFPVKEEICAREERNDVQRVADGGVKIANSMQYGPLVQDGFDFAAVSA
ncbi:hypothetical protein [Megalodesulfovibrio paquesii]